MTPRVHPGDLLALSAASMVGAALMALAAWANMAAYHAVCGSPAPRLAHCPACYGAVAFLVLALTSLTLARVESLRRAPQRLARGAWGR
ncbi:MAG: hypothetical protein ABW360_00560 [Phenylobacterium sp.]